MVLKIRKQAKAMKIMAENEFEKKYGIREDEKTKQFHGTRRMFAIIDGKLHIAESGDTRSHAVWFGSEGWISGPDDSRMDGICRGMVTPGNDAVYFYAGYDFHTGDEIEREFFAHLPELAERLGLSPQVPIYGGRNPEESWAPRKFCKTVGDALGEKASCR